VNELPPRDPELLERLRTEYERKVVRGRDGWLFLHNDTNRTMEQQAGIIRLNNMQLRNWRIVLDLRTAWLERLGIPYFVLIAPNAASVYPEKRPEGFEAVENRPVHQLIDHLEQAGSLARVIMPLQELLDAKRERLTYIPTDTHWNEFGAFVAYESLMDEMERRGVEVRRLRRDDLRITEDERLGDLGMRVDPPLTSPHVLVEPRAPSARMVEDNRVYNSGKNVVYECDGAPGRCFVHGDSFAYTMLHFLAESFGRLFYVHRPTFDYEAILAERPRAVVSIVTERFIIKVPQDLPYVPLARLVGLRRKQGAMLPPVKDPSSLRVLQEIPPHWDPYFEPDEVEEPGATPA
jgi:alginate O-acetyltransferase complex protein AlgJ